MKKLLYLLPAIALMSCHPKSREPVKEKTPEEVKADYMQKALQSDDYKNATQNFQRVRSILDSVKKGTMDSAAAIFVYNNSIATPTTQVKTIAQVKEGLKKDTIYLKTTQLKAAADLARADSVKNPKK